MLQSPNLVTPLIRRTYDSGICHIRGRIHFVRSVEARKIDCISYEEDRLISKAMISVTSLLRAYIVTHNSMEDEVAVAFLGEHLDREPPDVPEGIGCSIAWSDRRDSNEDLSFLANPVEEIGRGQV